MENIMTRRIKLTIEYDGSDFVGWQSQENGRAVQDVIEQSASSLLQEKIRVIGAGRTDAGVHALGQVAHFDTDSALDEFTIHRGLNALLPADITVHSVKDTDASFHARFSASSRTYSYFMTHQRISLGREQAWLLYYMLDERKIQEALECIKGTHDFTAFSRQSDDVENCYCHVFSARWIASGVSTRFQISANRFLYSMVRLIVGALVDVGRGKIPVEEFRTILESKSRGKIFSLAPAHGLVLESVQYDPEQYAFVKAIMSKWN